MAGTITMIMMTTRNITNAIRSGCSRSSRQTETSVFAALRVRDDTSFLNGIPEFSRFVVNRFAAQFAVDRFVWIDWFERVRSDVHPTSVTLKREHAIERVQWRRSAIRTYVRLTGSTDAADNLADLRLITLEKTAH